MGDETSDTLSLINRGTLKLPQRGLVMKRRNSDLGQAIRDIDTKFVGGAFEVGF